MTLTEFLDADAWLETSSGPRYLRLRRRIEQGIEKGLLQPATPLPTERQIATITGLSRVTVRKAMGELVRKGIVVQRQGSGSFVSDEVPRVEQSLSLLTSFTEDMARRGLATTSQWLERALFTPSPEEVVKLAIGLKDSVARLARLRFAEGQPLAIERAALPTDILPNPALVTRSLYEFMNQDGNRPVRAIQKISAMNLQSTDARLLRIEPGTAALKVERTSYLRSGRVVEFTQSIYHASAYDFVAELRLAEK